MRRATVFYSLLYLIFSTSILWSQMDNKKRSKPAANTYKIGSWAKYYLLSAIEKAPLPVDNIIITIGPEEKVKDNRFYWWELKVSKTGDEYFHIRILSEKIPLISKDAPGKIKRYLLKEKGNKPIEYIDLATNEALLPKFGFVSELLPQPMHYTYFDKGWAQTGSYLGHVISFAEAGNEGTWLEWEQPMEIKLNPQLIIYMHGLVRDKEGRYIYEGDYTYIPLTEEEINELISLGLNCLSVDDEYEEMIYQKPVFYYKRFKEKSKIKYPEILYRSNYLGPVPFIDEPGIRLVGDVTNINRIRRPEDGGWLLAQRLFKIWNRPHRTEWSPDLLRYQLQDIDVNVGTLSLKDEDIPIWETVVESSFYQLQYGASGVIHEGRYRLENYITQCEKILGTRLQLTVKELLLLHFAFMRGAARAFNKNWGVAIYGQCDPEIADDAITLAYDLGARYIWFWTYDHQHHLPHFMKLKLLKILQEHIANHPRKDIKELLNQPRTVIVSPYGYNFILGEHLWTSPFLYINYNNSAGVPHRKIEAIVLGEAIACARKNEEFDFAIDVGQEFCGYSRVIKVGKDGKREVFVNGVKVVPSEIVIRPTVEIYKHRPDNNFKIGKVEVKIPYVEDIQIDGDLKEWENANWIVLNKNTQYVRCKDDWKGEDDLSASIALARNEKYLFIAAKVKDDEFFQDKTEWEIWRGDSIQVAIDPLLDRSREYYNFDDVEFGFALTPKGPQVFMWKRYRYAEPCVLTSAKIAIKRQSANEMVYEVSIPWVDLFPQPYSFLDYFGISVLVNDNDGDGRRGYLELTPGIGKIKDPSSFAYAEVGAVPEDKIIDDLDIALHTTCQAVNYGENWELIGNGVCKKKSFIHIEVKGYSSDKIIRSICNFELPPGKHYFKIIFPAESLPGGIFEGQLVFTTTGNKKIYETDFITYIFRNK